MANPVLNENTFIENYSAYGESQGVMTKDGVIFKSTILLLLVIFAGAFSWRAASVFGNALIMAGALVGFLLALIISFKRTTAPYLSPVYALAEGCCLGAISAYFEQAYPGIVVQAVLGTFAVMFSLLALYASRVIVVTQKLRAIIFSATLGIALLYLVAFILSFFHITMPFLYDANPIGIGISIVIMIIAASNLLLDFDFIERGIESCAPAYMEWYCSFGLLVTLVWLYLEVLKLLAKFSRRR